MNLYELLRALNCDKLHVQLETEATQAMGVFLDIYDSSQNEMEKMKPYLEYKVRSIELIEDQLVITIIGDKLVKVQEQPEEQNKVTVKNIWNDNDHETTYVHLRLGNPSASYVPIENCLFDGWLKDLPMEYFNYVVIQTGISLTDEEKDINGYYVYVVEK